MKQRGPGLWREFQQANIAVKRLGDILDMPNEPYALTPSRKRNGNRKIDRTGVATANTTPLGFEQKN